MLTLWKHVKAAAIIIQLCKPNHFLVGMASECQLVSLENMKNKLCIYLMTYTFSSDPVAAMLDRTIMLQMKNPGSIVEHI